MVTKSRIASVDGEVNYTEYEYDFRNRMTRVTQYSSAPSEGGIILHQESHRYDALGRRIQVVSDGEEMISVYNGASFMANEWARFNLTGEVVQRFLFTNNIDQLVAQWTQVNGVAWTLTDHLGSIRDTVSNSEGIGRHVDYTAFGVPTFADSGAQAHPYAFTGRVWDDVLGMSFHRARYYDASIGRFVSPDPIGFTAGDTCLFRYASNSSTFAFDPSGGFGVIGYIALLGWIGVFAESAYSVYACKGEGGQAGGNDWKDPGQWGGEADFMRHCTWACCSARKSIFPAVIAYFWLIAWELNPGIVVNELKENIHDPNQAVFDITVSDYVGLFVAASSGSASCKDACRNLVAVYKNKFLV